MNDVLLQKITLSNFMSHANFELELPPVGVVVITGPSGAGKSSVIDATHWCLYGQTFREDGSPARTNSRAPTSVNVEAKGFYATRHMDRGKVRFSWGPDKNSLQEFVTPTAGTQAFSSLYGESDVWAVRNVLTSHDLTFFTKGRDSDRKKFLEAMLNFQVYDQPFEKLSAEFRDQTRELANLKNQQSVLVGKIEELGNQISSQISPTKPEKPEISSAEASEKIQQLLLKEESLTARRDEIQSQRHTLATYEEWLKTLGGGRCPTCNQAISKNLISEYREKASTLRQQVAEAVGAFKAEHEALTKELATWRAALATAQASERAIRDWEVAMERASRYADMLNQRMESFQEQLADIDLQIAIATDYLSHVKTCTEAVSTKGVRAWALSGALQEISRFTQRYLGLLDSPFSVEIKPTRTLANGKVVDEIDFQVLGAGNGKFNAASEGERQRIAFAVRMAISSLYGGRGTLFLDEVFAHLDDSHIDGFCNLISEVARDRNVVVITHDKTFAKALGGRHVAL